MQKEKFRISAVLSFFLIIFFSLPREMMEMSEIIPSCLFPYPFKFLIHFACVIRGIENVVVSVMHKEVIL